MRRGEYWVRPSVKMSIYDAGDAGDRVSLTVYDGMVGKAHSCVRKFGTARDLVGWIDSDTDVGMTQRERDSLITWLGGVPSCLSTERRRPR